MDRLAGAGRAVEQDALRGVDAEGDEALRVEQRGLDHLAQLVDLLLAPTDVVVAIHRFKNKRAQCRPKWID